MPIDLRKLFLSLQTQLSAKLQTVREVIQHPGAKGGAAELNWQGMLADYLPTRYQVSKAFVLDSDGGLSDEIDIVIHDRHHSPFLLREGGANYVPAESVYGVLEVKQELSKGTIEYAGQKVSSVRKLIRTSVPIPHAGGVFPPKEPFRILGGILCLESAWEPPLEPHLLANLSRLAEIGHLDLGCVLRSGAFDVVYPNGEPRVDMSAPTSALIFFFLRLLERLQAMGTVPALDLRKYGRPLLE